MLPCAIVLAGGKSRRFGTDKAIARVGNTTLIQLCIRNHLKLFTRVIVADKILDKLLHISTERVKVISDGDTATYATLIGLAAGLRASKSQLNYVVGCDMPFVVPDMIDQLHHMAKGRDCALRCDGSGATQPLGAFYSKDCLPVIDEMLRAKDYKLSRLDEKLDAVVMSYQSVLAFDPELQSFRNVNTQQDLDLVAKALSSH